MTPPPTLLSRSPEKGVEGKAHGTAMLSLVAGDSLGVAKNKNVKPILVRMPRRYFEGGNWTPHDWLHGLDMINNRLGTAVVGPDAPLKAIVLLAEAWIPTAFIKRKPGTGDYDLDEDGKTVYTYDAWVARVREILVEMASKGALIVTGSGNDRVTGINGWPAMFARENAGTAPVPMLVAAAISLDRKVIAYQTDLQYGLPHLYAPGIALQVAQGLQVRIGQGRYYKNSGGTSDGKPSLCKIFTR